MNGYAARKGNRWYAVIYEGLDPVTGKEVRRWHPAGTTKAGAEKLARRLAKDLDGPADAARSLSFGAYLTHTWLPAKRLEVKASTWDGYRRKVQRHILPTLAAIPIRRLRVAHLEQLYEAKMRPTDGSRALAPKSVLEIHLIIRAALNDAVVRGMLSRNVALVAKAPKLRSIEQIEPVAWTAQELRSFLQATVGHRLFPALWTSAHTGMRRSELCGLQWGDFDPDAATLSVNRGRIAVAYEVHEENNLSTRSGSAAARPATPDAASTSTPLPSPSSKRGAPGSTTNWHPSAQRTTAGCSPTDPASHSTPIRFRRPSNGSCGAPVCHSSDFTTCATPTPPCSSTPGYPPRSSPNASATPPPRSQSRPTNTCTHPCRPKPPKSSKPSSPTRLLPETPGGRPGRSQPEHGRSRTERPGFSTETGGGGRI